LQIDPPKAEWYRFRLGLRLRPDRSLCLLYFSQSINLYPIFNHFDFP